MKREIRIGVFETNSSSVHSLTMCMAHEYEDWKNGKLWFCEQKNPNFMETEKAKELNGNRDSWYYKYMPYNEWWDKNCDFRFERYTDKYKTENGDEIIAFGYYGEDH